MYLSRIQLTGEIAGNSQLGHLLKDRSYGMHRLLWDLFKQGERFLYRQESAREQLSTPRNLPLYYVLSQQPPCQSSPIFKIETKPFSPALQQGDRLAFRLRANPTVSRREANAKRSKRHDVVMDAQRQWLQVACREKNLDAGGTKGALKSRLQGHEDFTGKPGGLILEQELEAAAGKAAINWVRNRGPANGFELVACQATAYRWNALPEKSRTAGFSSMDFEGTLTVTDPELYIPRLFQGFGPSKAFGCGLMLIQRS